MRSKAPVWDASRKGRNRLVVLIPTLNEEPGLAATVESIPLVELSNAGWTTTVWVVDGNSTDRTVAIAKGLGARVFVQEGRGKGNAFRQAIKAIDCDVLAMLDGDGTYPGEFLPALVAHVRDGADFAMGSRFMGTIEPGAMPRPNRLGNQFISLLSTVLWGRRLRDLNTGMVAFWKPALDALPLKAEGFEIEAEVYACSVRAGLRIDQVPIDYKPRLGESKIGGMGTALRIFRTVVRLRFKR
ncbi:MAG: glycosyltransferase [Candidatus Thermoplasmatota archaeon]|jgi:dolichol-phosphate mannosyltransferase